MAEFEKNISTFLTIDSIPGESQFVQKPGSIEIMEWSHSFDQPTSMSRSTGSGAAGRAKHNFLFYRKLIDSTSVPLLQKCWKGEQIPTMVISCFNTDMKEYLTITMTDAIVSHFEVKEAWDSKTGVPEEVHGINYGKIQYDYKPIDSTGALLGSLVCEHNLVDGTIA